MWSEEERQTTRRAITEAVSAQEAGGVLALVRRLVGNSSKATDVMFCATALGRVGDAQVEQLGGRRLKTFIVRSVTVEPMLPSLTIEAALAGFVLEVKLGGYGSFFEELLSPQSQLQQFAPRLVLVLLDLEDVAGGLPDVCAGGGHAEVEQEIDVAFGRIEHVLQSFRSSSSAPVMVQGFVVPDATSLGDVGDANLAYSLPFAVVELNRRLARLCSGMAGFVFFDVDRLAARYGRAVWRDTRMFLASRLPVASDAFATYTRGLVRCFSVLLRAARKVLCTDLDNTLWGGVLGEDGVDGIVTGAAFPGNSYLEYQRYLKRLSARGILLTIVSKNNDADVRQAFQARGADLALKLDDFVATKISWGEKAESLRELAAELSLGLDSFVFVDDNPVECAAIRQYLPEVAVVEAPVQEPWKLSGMLAGEAFFDVATVTTEDANRLGEYKAQAERAKLHEASLSHEEFLASLGIVCTFQSALEAPLARAVQLLAKTNQFNLTTRRHSAAEVEAFAAAEGGQAVVVRVRDRFGDAGVVGLALARTRGGSCLIDSLLLSCRVIGRGIETALLAHLAENAVQAGAKHLVGEFVPTKKNAPCASFYPDHGFKEIPGPSGAEESSHFYQFDLADSTIPSPTWITLEGNAPHESSASALVAS